MLGPRVFEPFRPASQRVVWGVAALLHAIGDALQARFSGCAVEGELSGFTRAASGHCYFSLKDAEGAGALLRCAMFRRAATLLDFAPADGQLVELRGRLTLYEPRGELQFVVESMRRAGAGALFERFLRLKAALESEGLFDAGRKRPLPTFPTRLGIITSTAGAALHDVLTALQRRAPQVALIVYPSPVQGAEAPPALVRAIQEANARAEVDALLLCRGGGSLEDLWAFNDERVVRAVAASALPIICGVGHETDITLSDLAADLRAPTPTAAAELAAPERIAELERLSGAANMLQRRVERQLDGATQRLDRVAMRLARPAAAVQREGRRLDLLAQRWGQALPRMQGLQLQSLASLAQRRERALETSLQRQSARLDGLQSRLQALDPKRVLSRGYAWLDDGRGRALSSVTQLQAGAEVQAVLSDGSARLQVLATQAGE